MTLVAEVSDKMAWELMHLFDGSIVIGSSVALLSFAIFMSVYKNYILESVYYCLGMMYFLLALMAIYCNYKFIFQGDSDKLSYIMETGDYIHLYIDIAIYAISCLISILGIPAIIISMLGKDKKL